MKFFNLLGRLFEYGIARRGIIAKSEIYKYLPKQATVIEAGAHKGYDTIELARHFPDGKIFAFEPVPALFEELNYNTRSFENIQLFKFALSDRSGKAKMFISSGASTGSSSLLPPKDHLVDHPDVLFKEEITVDCITIDEWAEKEHLEKIDFLWLDLQGHELNVLKAATNILKTVIVIYTEINLKEVYEGAPLYHELRQWLECQGFKTQKEAIPWKDGGNVLFIRKQ